MKKILIAFDNMHYSEGAMQFIIDLNQLTPLSITGVFLPQIDYSALWSFEAGANPGRLFVPFAEEMQAETVRETIDRFEACCRQHNLKYNVHKDFFDFTLTELQQETRFADLLVIGSEVFYASKGGDQVNDFLQDVLRHTECPVMLVPEAASFPQSNILTYDGSESSVFAIKQFAYLFPELCDRKTLIVYIDKDKNVSMPNEKLLKDLVSRHFDQPAYLSLHIDPSKELSTWLSEQRGAVAISGSFGRSATSQFFRRSFLYGVVGDHHVPVFIAHK